MRTSPHGPIGERGIAPVLGVVLLIAVAVALATVVAVATGGLSPGPARGPVAFDLAADGDEGTITLEHVAGDPVEVDELSVTIAVDGEPLAHQPPVPFAGATGFDQAPSGPFNSASDSTWTAGERATLSVAGTNEPTIGSGDAVSVTLAVGGRQVAALETTAD
ncbi:type IV pilin N-terminal domain-containing protein [Natronococcus jeotgali]|uniref:Flagellin domain-containing protein n=1 Tax=Natronococcus jeotgali DSM 18795 TaxID=1227498 RepID=L9XVL4_9EURY|nr:type IV pilin N-terminal domain-containing protein [Natronococcus jeotgali]ELY65461.1 flagellin domain-containing protein [Natronococcus jeotgali DSM 18795]